MGEFVERVAAEAVAVKPMRVVATVVAVPFWVLGMVAGLVWFCCVFAAGAVKVGFADVRARLSVGGEVRAATVDD
jgi:hypothetical protein